MQFRHLVVVAIFLVSQSSRVNAALFGSQVEIEYLYPDKATSAGSTNNPIFATVGAGVEAPALLTNPTMTVDIDATSITINAWRNYGGYPDTAQLTAATFNGLLVTGINGSTLGVTGLTVDPATTMAGLDSSRLSFDGNDIFINMQGLSYTPDTVVRVDAQSVPEPSTAFSILSAAIALSARHRRSYCRLPG